MRRRFTYGLLLTIMACSQALAQSNLEIKNYLILGVETAEELASLYLEPLSEGLLYGLTGAWNHSAQVKKPWELDIALVANGSFVPSEKLFKEIDISAIDNLEVLGGANRVRIPTILGSETSEVTFVGTYNDEEFIFDAPTGIGLFSTNLLPNVFVQASMGLPYDTEIGFRFFPKLKIDDATLGIFGFGLKHELGQSIKAMSNWPVSIAVFGAFTRLDAEYEFKTDGFVTGEGQRIDAFLNSWLVEGLASTKFPKLNVYGGFGYVRGKSNYVLKGTYTIETETETLDFVDPFDVQGDISGLKGSLGASLRLSRFRINLDYTFQGFNNLAFGLHYNLVKPK
ncbi:DUF6588 family protein [Flagellimonas sp. DF-77]|uniref:DUF6588 family protein n=1 Tax=Flagellimonas algarum TaxID=3230298 RepID=UPI0033997BFF